MADVDANGLDGLIHGEMAPGFIGLLLGRIVDRLVEEGAQPAREAGIAAPPRTFSMIMLLARASQTVTELAQRLGVTHAAVIKTERMLEKLGLVERGQDAGDARRKPLCLTARVSRVYAGLFDEIGVDLFAAARAFDAALDREGFAERYRRI